MGRAEHRMTAFPLSQYWTLLSRYLAPQRARVGLLAVLLLGNVALGLLSPLIMRRFLDAAVAGSPVAVLTNVALLFVAVAIVQELVGVGQSYLAEEVGWTTTNRMRGELARHCLGLDLAFHNAHLPGELIERIDGDVAILSNFFSRFALRVLAALLLLAGALAVLTAVDWRLGAAFALFSAFGLAVLHRIRNVAVPYSKADRQTSADLFGYIEERLSGTEDVRSRGATGYVLRGLYQQMRQRLRARRNAATMFTASWGAMIMVFALGTALAYALSGALFQAGLITIGTVYVVLSYARMVTGPLSQLSQQLQDLQQATASIIRVHDLLQLPGEVDDPPGATPLPRGPLAVQLDRVSFAYRSAPAASLPAGANGANGAAGHVGSADAGLAASAVLHDVSFDLAPGRVLGILGRTGSGKSTITRLLLRLYQPGAGAVRLGGVDLTRARLRDVRARVGLVTQEVQLFEGSVRDNLTFYDRTIADAQILAAFDALGLRPWYDALPAGLETPLAARGAGLSAGEAQLLAFARVFLKDPGLVILDEASSRLDPATERLIEGAVDVLLRGRTAIVVAHRLATVQRADEILILEDGRVRERGPRVTLASDPRSRFATLLRTGLEVALA
jgi:ABC-type multidrug transport system fused ATPase/permease subunit